MGPTNATDNRAPRAGRDMTPENPMPLNTPTSLFEREALTVTLEGRVSLIAALLGRMREVMTGLVNHPRIRQLEEDDQKMVERLVHALGDAGADVAGLSVALFEQDPNVQRRSLGARRRGTGTWTPPAPHQTERRQGEPERGPDGLPPVFSDR